MRYSLYQPREYLSKSDYHLPQLVRQMKRYLRNTQRTFRYNALKLDNDALEELAGILLDFAVDIHSDIGIWGAYEQYNVDFFGKPLPLTTQEQPQGLAIKRIQHLLWLVYSEINPDLILAPYHEDLISLAGAAHKFLQEKISVLPEDSGVKAFLATSNTYAWDVKRKLLWLGTKSYMFRLAFDNYLARNNKGEWDIEYADDFICQECTRWSGLGVNDILSGVLKLTEEERKDLSSWYERMLSGYMLEDVSNKILTATNIFTRRKYVIRMNMDKQPFKPGQLVVGSLTPWRDEWYWSGKQKVYTDPTDEFIEDLKASMKKGCSSIVCRYDKKYEKLVRERAADYHAFAMKYYGKDLIIYPDGLAMAADWERELRAHWESAPPEQAQEAIKRHKLKNGKPNMPLPQSILDADNGIGVFLNPEEGKEIMTEFDTLVSGLKKKGQDLSKDEEDVIRGFVKSSVCSPAFVRRVARDYGTDSIRFSFRLDKCSDEAWFDWLLRQQKGHFYRKRYPSVAII